MVLTVSASEPQLHFIPRFNIYGQLLPLGKGDGIGARTSVTEEAGSGTVSAPEDWMRNAAFQSNSEMMQQRKNEQLNELKKSQSAVQIRSIQEMRGGQQMRSIVTGEGYAKDDLRSKARSKMLRDRREDNYNDIKLLAARYVEPKVRVIEAFKEKGGDAVGSECAILPKQADSTNREVRRPYTTALSRPLTDCKREVIADRPLSPTLQWADESKTRSQVLSERKKELQAQLESNAIKFMMEPRREKELRLRPRVTGPYDHMQAPGNNDFGRTTKDQFNCSSQAKLFELRRNDFNEQLEKSKAAADTREMEKTLSITQPILRSSTPWWEIGRSETETLRVKNKHEELLSVYREKRESVTADPASGGQYRSQELARRKLLKQTPDKITNLAKYDLKKHAVERQRTNNHFTDAVIEFRNQAIMPVLDDNGKKCTYDPGENAPMYSSFSPDGVFLEAEERKRVNLERARQEDEVKSKLKLPLRTYAVPRSPTSQNSGLVADSHAADTAVAQFVAEVGVVGKRHAPNSSPKIRTGGFLGTRE